MRWFCAPPIRVAYFSSDAQAREGLAGVEQDRAGAGDRVDIAAGQGGDAGQVLDRVERGALGGEQGPRFAGQPQQDRSPAGDAVAILDQPLDLDVGSSARKKASAIGRPATTIGSRLSHHAVEARFGGDHRRAT